MLPLLIAAGAGALFGGLSAWNSSRKEQGRFRQQQRMAEAAYGYKQAYSEGMWGLERTQSLENLGIAKNRLAGAFGMDLQGFNLGLEGQAAGNQAARVSLADSTGMALAAQGASGGRGSEALQRRIDFQEGQFEKQLNLQEKGNSLSLQGMTQRYSNQFDDIGREIDSWGPGGYRTRAKSLQDVYASQMHGLEIQGYKNAIDEAAAGPLDYLTGIFSGPASGASFGSQVGGLLNQMGGVSPSLSLPGAYPAGETPGYSFRWDGGGQVVPFVDQDDLYGFGKFSFAGIK